MFIDSTGTKSSSLRSVGQLVLLVNQKHWEAGGVDCFNSIGHI